MNKKKLQSNNGKCSERQRRLCNLYEFFKVYMTKLSHKNNNNKKKYSKFNKISTLRINKQMMELQSRGKCVHTTINRWNVGCSWIVNVYILFGLLSGFVWSDQGKCDKISTEKMGFSYRNIWNGFPAIVRPSS